MLLLAVASTGRVCHSGGWVAAAKRGPGGGPPGPDTILSGGETIVLSKVWFPIPPRFLPVHQLRSAALDSAAPPRDPPPGPRPLIVVLHGYGDEPAPNAELYRKAARRRGAIVAAPSGVYSVNLETRFGIRVIVKMEDHVDRVPIQFDLERGVVAAESDKGT